MYLGSSSSHVSKFKVAGYIFIQASRFQKNFITWYFKKGIVITATTLESPLVTGPKEERLTGEGMFVLTLEDTVRRPEENCFRGKSFIQKRENKQEFLRTRTGGEGEREERKVMAKPRQQARECSVPHSSLRTCFPQGTVTFVSLPLYRRSQELLLSLLTFNCWLFWNPRLCATRQESDHWDYSPAHFWGRSHTNVVAAMPRAEGSLKL